MKNFDASPEFTKSFARLSRKYRTLQSDFATLKSVLEKYPAGVGKNFTIIHAEEACTIVKARMACRALRDRSLRVVYAYEKERERFYFIELYFKGEQTNENRGLIREYLRNIQGKLDKV